MIDHPFPIQFCHLLLPLISQFGIKLNFVSFPPFQFRSLTIKNGRKFGKLIVPDFSDQELAIVFRDSNH